MPHVTIQGPVSVQDLVREFQPEIRKEPAIVRLADAFLSSTGAKALVEAVVVESGWSRRFYIEVHDKDDGVGVRLEPLTRPEVTDAVRHAVALVATKIMSQSPESSVHRTNIGEFLQAGPSDV